MRATCEICGKPQSPYPNWIVSKGRQMHVGCMADALELYDKQRKFLLDRCISGGNFGPFANGWNEEWQKLWDQCADDQFEQFKAEHPQTPT